MTELEKLVNEKKGGSRNAASSNSYLSELVEKKKAESKAWTPYADAAKGNSGAKNLYAAAAGQCRTKAGRRRRSMPTRRRS